jgi:hypothetical protein
MNKGKKKPDLTGRKVDGSPGLGGEVAATTMKYGIALVLNELAEEKWLLYETFLLGSPQRSFVVCSIPI